MYRIHPEISITVETSAFNSEDQLNLPETGFKLAFGAMDYSDRTLVQDESRVKWRVTLDTYQDLAIMETQYLDFHKCNDEDYRDFYPIVSSDEQFLQELKER